MDDDRDKITKIEHRLERHIEHLQAMLTTLRSGNAIGPDFGQFEQSIETTALNIYHASRD